MDISIFKRKLNIIVLWCKAGYVILNSTVQKIILMENIHWLDNVLTLTETRIVKDCLVTHTTAFVYQCTKWTNDTLCVFVGMRFESQYHQNCLFNFIQCLLFIEHTHTDCSPYFDIWSDFCFLLKNNSRILFSTHRFLAYFASFWYAAFSLWLAKIDGNISDREDALLVYIRFDVERM